MRGITSKRCGVAAVCCLYAGTLSGAGFEVPGPGIKEMGVAFGGMAALLEDPTAISNNPAGMTRLSGTQVSGGLALIQSEFDYDVEVRRELIDEVGGTVPGAKDDRVEGQAEIPHLFISHEISPDAFVGLGVYAPFGTSMDYGDEWAGRYHATVTELTTINIAPTFAFRVTETLSLGLGLKIQYAEANFENNIDLGYVVADELIHQIESMETSDALADGVGDVPLLGPILGAIVEVGSTPIDGLTGIEFAEGQEGVVEDLAHEFDVSNQLEGDNWAYGFNMGLLWEPGEWTRLGLNYQSQINQSVDGTASRPQITDPAFQQRLLETIENIPIEMTVLNGPGVEVGTIGDLQPEAAEDGVATAIGPLGIGEDDVNSAVTAPEVLTLSFYQGLTDSLAITGGATFTKWSRIPEIRFTYPDTSDEGGSDITGTGDDVRRRDLVVPFRWEDTWRYGLGLILERRNLTYRAGFAYDESPVPDKFRRTPRGPDNDRRIYSVGFSWQPSERLSLDFAYSHTDIQESSIENPDNPVGSQHVMSGTFDGQFDSYGLQANLQF